MSFTIYPAIDMLGGKCVRLLQGDYNKETVYGDSPFQMAKSFADAGASWIHMVDLDGAKEGTPVNNESVLQVSQQLSAKVQIGGGIRTEKEVESYLSQGVDRVILGSAAINDPSFVKKMLSQYGEKIAIGIDAKDGYVATEGWTTTSKVKATDLGVLLAEAGAETFIFTDIATDGMLSGPNIEATVELARITGKSVIASGGVSNLEDILALKKYENEGIVGAIVGKAIYTNKIDLRAALNEVSTV